MSVTEKLKNSQKPLLSFELLPPLRGKNISTIYNAVEKLIEFEPSYINFTAHQDEIVYKERPDGLLEKHSVKKRPGTIALSAAVKYKYNIDVIPHLICAGFTKEETESALIEMNFLGLNDVFALRGDAKKHLKRFEPEINGHRYAHELISQISNMTNGIYLDETNDGAKTNFCIGAAAYPEKHIESPNMEICLTHLKEKIDAGAEYIITQMFFINEKFFKFRDLCKKHSINVPIIPGLKPIITAKDIELLPQTFSIDLPTDLVNEIKKATSPANIKQIGAEWAVAQSKELLAAGVPAIHYYTLGNSDDMNSIIKEVF